MRATPVIVINPLWLIAWPVTKGVLVLIALCSLGDLDLHRTLHANLASLTLASPGALIGLWYLRRWGAFGWLRQMFRRARPVASNVVAFRRYRHFRRV